MWQWLEAHSGAAAWFGSLGTLIAVIVAAVTIFIQHRNALNAERLKRDTDEAMAILALWYLGKEVRQMIALSSYQINKPGNNIFYHDISSEFHSIGKMLDQLPVERLAARACIGEWHSIRRVAAEMSSKYKVAPQPGDGFIFTHRDRFQELSKICHVAEREIAENLTQFAPLV